MLKDSQQEIAKVSEVDGTKNSNILASMGQFCLNDWRVEVSANRLRRGPQDIKIESKVMEVLVYLAGRSGELVTREELERDVWAGRIVGYESLTSTINKLRKALSDDSRNPQYIETVSKKGYRLIANVSNCADKFKTDGSTARQKINTKNSTRIGIKAVLSVIVLVVIYAAVRQYLNDSQQSSPNSDQPSKSLIRNTAPSVVVLPFSDISSDSSKRYLGDGITEDVTTALSKLSGLFVIARSTAMNFKDRALNVKDIAKKLDVQYVIEGSVQREGQKLRVNAKLIDGSTGFNIWAEQYDREVTDIFSVQDNIASKIVNALSVKLTEQEKRQNATRFTISFAAYDKFLQGQVLYIRRTKDDNLKARELFLQSIELDANFARAYSANALTYVAEYRYGWRSDRNKTLKRAQELAEQAVAIDDQLPQAYYVLGFVYLQLRDYDHAIIEAKKAIELNPNFADGFATLSVCLIYQGDLETGVTMMQQAIRLNPQYPAPYAAVLGQALYFLHRYDEALPMLRDAVERNLNLITSQVFLIATLSHLGLRDDTNWAVLQFKTLFPTFRVDNTADIFPIKDNKYLQSLMDDLRSAGLK